MSPSAEILRRARALIATPEQWTQGTNYRDAIGIPCGPDHARRYCAIGALTAACNHAGDRYYCARNLLEIAFGNIPVSHANDNATHAEVLSAFSRAIALAERQEESAP